MFFGQDLSDWPMSGVVALCEARHSRRHLRVRTVFLSRSSPSLRGPLLRRPFLRGPLLPGLSLRGAPQVTTADRNRVGGRCLVKVEPLRISS